MKFRLASRSGFAATVGLSLLLSFAPGATAQEPKAEAPPDAKVEAAAAPAAPDMTVTPKDPDSTGGKYTGAVTTGQLTKDGDKVTPGRSRRT